MFAPFMVVNHAWRCLLAQGGDPKSNGIPPAGVGEAERAVSEKRRLATQGAGPSVTGL